MWRSRVAPLLMAGFLLMALMLPAAPVQAAPAALTLTEKDSGRTVTLKVGETLVLNLRNPASGGYNVLPPAFDDKILTFMYRRPKSSGDFGRLEFAWQARQAGDTEVTVNIARPWEQNTPPEVSWKTGSGSKTNANMLVAQASGLWRSIKDATGAGLEDPVCQPALFRRPKKIGGRPDQTPDHPPGPLPGRFLRDRGKPPRQP